MNPKHEYKVPRGVEIETITIEERRDVCEETVKSSTCEGIGCVSCALRNDESLIATKKHHEGVYTGGSSSYYKIRVENPTTLPEPYDTECNDIIEALKMTFAEANVFKATWRSAASRLGKQKKGNNRVYDAEKVIFFGERMKVIAENE